MSHTPEQMRKKEEAMEESHRHMKHATMTGMGDGRDYQNRKSVPTDESGAAAAEELGRVY